MNSLESEKQDLELNLHALRKAASEVVAVQELYGRIY